MHDHLSLEQLAALVDEPAAVSSGQEHLETCERCRAEYTALSRIRGMLSTMPDLSAPEHEWEHLEARAFVDRPHGMRSSARIRRTFWPLALRTAAGVVLLLGGGVLVGLRMQRQQGAAPDARALLAFARLDSLRRASAPDTSGSGRDSATAIRSLATLKALGDASREALTYAPADPLVNGYLDQVSRQQADWESRFGSRAARDSTVARARYDSVRGRARTYFRDITAWSPNGLGQALQDESFVLGAQLVPVDSTLRERLHGASPGLLVVKVLQDTPALRLGLQAGDIVIAADGQPVHKVADLRGAIGSAFGLQHEVKLTWLRGGSRKSAVLSPRSPPR